LIINSKSLELNNKLNLATGVTQVEVVADYCTWLDVYNNWGSELAVISNSLELYKLTLATGDLQIELSGLSMALKL